MSEATRKDDIIQGDLFGQIAKDVDKAKTSLKEYDETLKSIAKTFREDLKTVNKETIENLSKLNKLEKESIKLTDKKKSNQKSLTTLEKEELKIKKAVEKAQAQKILASKEENKELQRLNAEKNKINKATRDEAKNAERSKDAYKALVDATRDQKNESKRLGAELLKLEANGKKGTDAFDRLEKQYEETTAAARKGDAQLKKLDKTVGDNFRNVGNYSSGVDKLKNSLATLGVAIGVGEVFRGFFNFNKEISRATNQAQTLFQVSREGAKQIAKDATLIGKAYDKDVNEVLKAGNVLQRQFGLTSERSFELMEKGFQKGADVSGEFLENVSEYSTQLRLAGLSAEESISIITQSQQQGVFSDKGIDAIKEATLSLREMTPPAKEALEAIGMSAEKVQKDIASGTKTYFDVIQEISAKTNEVGEESQAAGMILADVFKGAGEDAGDFIFSLGEMNTDLEDLEDTNKGLDGAIQNLTKSFYEMLFGIEEGTGLMDKFAGVINFVANNMSTIVGTLGKLLGLYLIMIARQKVLNSGMLEYAKNLFTASNNQKGLNKSMNDGSSSGAKFGKALKNIGWAALIGFALDLANAFYDIATGASRARYEAEQLEKAQQRIGGANLNLINKVNKALDERIKKINEERNLGNITAKEAEDQRQKAIDSAKAQLKAETDVSEDRVKQLKGRIEVLQQLTEILNQQQMAIPLSQGALSDLMNEYGFEVGEDPFDMLSKAKADLEAYTATIEALETEHTKLNGRASESADEFKNMSKSLKSNTTDTEKNTKAKKKLRVELEEIEGILSESTLTDIENEEISQENERIQRLLDERLTLINDNERKGIISAEEAANQRNQAQLQALEDEKKMLLNYYDVNSGEIVKINKAISEKRLEISNNENARQKELEAERLRQQKEAQKELYDTINQAQQNITKVYSDHIDKRIELAQKEIDSQKELRSILKAQADQGNITAQEDIKATIEAEREKEAEIIRLEERKQKVQMISQGIQTYLNLLEGGEKPAMALAKTAITSKELISLLTGLPGLWTGTDNAPEGWAWTQEKGAEIITDKAGNIKSIGEDGGAKLTYLEKGDKVKTASETNSILNSFDRLENSKSITKTDTAGNTYDLMRLGSKLDKIERAIKSQPQNNSQFESITKGLHTLTNTTTRGGDKQVSKHYFKR